MARAPGWIKVGGPYKVPGKNEGMIYMRLRPWHPSFWPELWQMLAVSPRILKPLVWCYLLARLIWAMR